MTFILYCTFIVKWLWKNKRMNGQYLKNFLYRFMRGSLKVTNKLWITLHTKVFSAILYCSGDRLKNVSFEWHLLLCYCLLQQSRFHVGNAELACKSFIIHSLGSIQAKLQYYCWCPHKSKINVTKKSIAGWQFIRGQYWSRPDMMT